jgi:hypothetical protein
MQAGTQRAKGFVQQHGRAIDAIGEARLAKGALTSFEVAGTVAANTPAI